MGSIIYRPRRPHKAAWTRKNNRRRREAHRSKGLYFEVFIVYMDKKKCMVKIEHVQTSQKEESPY